MTDLRPADWLVESLLSWGPTAATVASFLPDGFDAYGRLLHPGYRLTRDGELRRVRWRELAGPDVPIVATTGFHELIGLPPQTLDGSVEHADRYGVSQEPADGDMDRDDLVALVVHLRPWTNSPDDIWFCIWEGYGWQELPTADVGPPRVRLPHRSHLLCNGRIDDALALPYGHAPTLWWPADHSWCVGTEVDGYATYIATSEPCFEALTSEPRLEVVRSQRNDRLAPY